MTLMNSRREEREAEKAEFGVGNKLKKKFRKLLLCVVFASFIFSFFGKIEKQWLEKEKEKNLLEKWKSRDIFTSQC